MAKRKAAATQDETSIAWDSYGMVEIVDAIISRDFSKQEANLNYGTSSGNTIPAYFKETLSTLKSINFSNVDIVTIEYGTNDYRDGLLLDEVDNLYSFGGALRYVLKKLQENFPKLKILVITPLFRSWSDGTDSDTKDWGTGTLIDYINKEEEICKQFKVPMYNVYFESGMSFYNRDYYWSNNDYTHPNEKGRLRYAEGLYGKLKTI